MSLFSPAESRIVEELQAIDLDRMTPIEALSTLANLKARIKKDTA